MIGLSSVSSRWGDVTRISGSWDVDVGCLRNVAGRMLEFLEVGM